MRSLIIIEVEHGETTDPLGRVIQQATARDASGNDGFIIKNYTVRVDLPECFKLEES